MEKQSSQVSVSMSEITINGKVVPQMDVVIAGSPDMGKIASLMKTINAAAETITDNYIAVTDVSHLEVSSFFRSLILFGMEKSYKMFLSVKHPSVMSFVILGKNNNEDTRRIQNSLNMINKTDAKKQYYYNYFFVQNKEQVQAAAEKYYKPLIL